METKPERWTLFVVYCVTLDIAYLGVTAMGVGLTVWGASIEGPDQAELIITGAMLALVSLPFLVLTAVAPFLPRKKWAYTYHLLLIALGVTSCLWWPLVIPLLITWAKPETRAWYEQDLEDVFE